MSSVAEPKAPPTNRVGLTVKEYGGLKSTLCVGCGHDVITRQITQAFFDMGVEPYRTAKMSGIGCSSKTTAYFADRGHGFNAVHGRMPAVATGAVLANYLLRRNVPMIYIVENNGVYGLTKGQFSATADMGSKLKTGVVNDLPAIDLCAMAIELGCAYVARSFSGDMKQLLALLKGAVAHRGTALLDVISPCVTFNNHEDSTKSYKWAKDHEIPIQEIGFIPFFDEIAVDYDPGTTQDVELHDGSHIRLKKLREDYDPTNKRAAFDLLHEAQEKGEFLTGLIYVEPQKKDFVTLLGLTDEPLATLPLDRVRPGREALAQMMEELR